MTRVTYQLLVAYSDIGIRFTGLILLVLLCMLVMVVITSQVVALRYRVFLARNEHRVNR